MGPSQTLGTGSLTTHPRMRDRDYGAHYASPCSPDISASCIEPGREECRDRHGVVEEHKHSMPESLGSISIW